MKVKPGAVICDVSRPFDISNEDTLKRPDVMVIASGEVYLPGENLKMRTDIGLEGDAVYACLAETALLAMEGRFEPFTLSKNIDYKKVIEIDRMAKDHGVRLASIMGHFGEISDQEFELCVEHAKEAKRIAHE
jgi:predicted amino acid dehydrogenase